MRIGELAAATGTDTATLRYYEEVGLLPAAVREANGYRRYTEQAVQRVAFIRHCRELDLGLAEIEQLLALTEYPEANCDDLNRLLDTHLAQVRAKQDALARLESQLLALRGRCASTRRAGDCGILQELLQGSQEEPDPDLPPSRVSD